MDEPFGALDELTRIEMQDELLRVWSTRKKTVFVTHSIWEALVLSDRVVVLGGRPGRVRLDLAVDVPTARAYRPAADRALWRDLVAPLVTADRAGAVALVGLAVLAAVVLAWESAARAGWLVPFYFPAPSRLASTLQELLVTGFPQGVGMGTHIGVTLGRIAQGFALGIGLAVWRGS